MLLGSKKLQSGVFIHDFVNERVQILKFSIGMPYKLRELETKLNYLLNASSVKECPATPHLSGTKHR